MYNEREQCLDHTGRSPQGKPPRREAPETWGKVHESGTDSGRRLVEPGWVSATQELRCEKRLQWKEGPDPTGSLGRGMIQFPDKCSGNTEGAWGQGCKLNWFFL